MKVQDIARGGLLVAAAVVLLWMGSALPWIAAFSCMAAGVCSAVPLLRHGRVKTSVLVFLAATVLAALIVPRRTPVIVYAAFTGLYPVLKYVIEAYAPRMVQPTFKFIYFNLCLLAGYVLIRYGLFEAVAVPGFWRMLALWFIANLIFRAYDTGLSRLIATLRRRLPPL